jgi:aquaporin Z
VQEPPNQPLHANVAAAAVLYVIASGEAGFSFADGFAANGYGEHSLNAAWIPEFVLTFMFLFVILGATDSRAPPVPISLHFTLHLAPRLASARQDSLG